MNEIKYKYINIIRKERDNYTQWMFPSLTRYILSKIKREPCHMIWRWQKMSRITDYYNEMRSVSQNPWYKLMYIVCTRIRNKRAVILGLEIDTINIGEGLMVFHGNNVINGYSIIGKNLHLHGCNVIGNVGPNCPTGCPRIGDNVMLGAGAKVIGDIRIADNIKIAAGAVVVHSFEEPNITIAGIPARKVK